LPAPAEQNVFNKLNKCYFELQRSDISQGASKKLKVVQTLMLGLPEKKLLKIFKSNTVLVNIRQLLKS
jgi:hypothetical protein